MELFLINRLILGNRLDAIDKQGGRSLCLLIPEGRPSVSLYRPPLLNAERE